MAIKRESVRRDGVHTCLHVMHPIRVQVNLTDSEDAEGIRAWR